MAVVQPLIEVRGASFKFGARPVFAALDLDVNPVKSHHSRP